MDHKAHEKFQAIEKDPSTPLEKKIKEMEELRKITEEYLKGYEFEPSELEEVAEKYGTDLREGTKRLMDKLCELNIPVLVFSAGLGDIVEVVLRQKEVYLQNVEIISNFLKYSGKMLDGFKGKSIHVYNKDETVLDEKDLKKLENRKNVILMGDNLGDATMSNGIKNVENVLKIGFLYNKNNEIVEKMLKDYMNTFDVVLIDDQTMDFPWSILERIH